MSTSVTSPGTSVLGKRPRSPGRRRPNSIPSADGEYCMAIVVVGGQSRNVGKTSLVANLIKAVPERRWTAVKITQHEHDLPPDANYVIREEMRRLRRRAILPATCAPAHAVRCCLAPAQAA